MANEHTGDHKGAERAYRRGIELAPDNAELHNALGWTLFQDGRTAEAVAEYERALAVESEAREGAQQPGARAGGARAARRRRRATSRPRSRSSPRRRSTATSDSLWRGSGKTEEALADYQKALELDPNCASAHFNLAVTLRAGRATSRGRKRTTARRSRPSPPPRPTTASATCSPGRAAADEAVGEFQKAIDVDPNFTPAYNNLAEALAQQGKLEEAAEYYRRSLAEKPSPAVHNALAAVLARLGGTGEAQQVRKPPPPVTGE